MKHIKVREPIKLTCLSFWNSHWRQQLYISLQSILLFNSSLDWNKATDYNSKPARRKKGENIAIEKNYKESNLE